MKQFACLLLVLAVGCFTQPPSVAPAPERPKGRLAEKTEGRGLLIDPIPATDKLADLLDLIDAGRVDVKVAEAKMEAIVLAVDFRGKSPVAFCVKIGTHFRASLAVYQNLITIGEICVSEKAAGKPVSVPTCCTNRMRDEPNKKSYLDGKPSYTIHRLAPANPLVKLAVEVAPMKGRPDEKQWKFWRGVERLNIED